MIPVVKQDIISVLKDAEACISEGNVSRLGELSDHTIHNSSIYQDEDSITIAVVIYSIKKIYDRAVNVNLEEIRKLIAHARMHLAKEQMQLYKAIIKKLTKAISESDSKFRVYIQDVIDKAHIKKGSRLYYHGISLAQAANLLGVSQWELMSYVGKTQMADNPALPINNVRERLNFARKVLMR